jgi:hypothetical protein
MAAHALPDDAERARAGGQLTALQALDVRIDEIELGVRDARGRPRGHVLTTHVEFARVKGARSVLRR